MKYIRKTLIYLLAILIILQCYSLLSMIVPNRYFYVLINLLLVCLMVLGGKFKRDHKIELLILSYLIFVALLFTSGYFRNFEFILSVYTPFVLFLILLMNTKYLGIYLDAFTNVVFVICVLSLIFFVFGSLLDIVQPTGYYSYNEIGWGTNNYYDFYHLYCEGQTVFALGYSGVRNIALFVEGPMLTYVISFAFYYELFFRKLGSRKIVIATFIATIITSFSTTGILVVLALMFIKFYEVIKKNKFLKFFVIPIIIFVTGYMAIFVVQDKFASNVYSASARLDDILASFKCFFSDIFNGVGYQNMDALGPYRLFRRANAGLSTGFGSILAYGGILWGIWYIAPFIMAIVNYIRRPAMREKMGFVFMAFALLMMTVVQSRVLCTITNAICWYFILQKKYLITDES